MEKSPRKIMFYAHILKQYISIGWHLLDDKIHLIFQNDITPLCFQISLFKKSYMCLLINMEWIPFIRAHFSGVSLNLNEMSQCLFKDPRVLPDIQGMNVQYLVFSYTIGLNNKMKIMPYIFCFHFPLKHLSGSLRNTMAVLKQSHLDSSGNAYLSAPGTRTRNPWYSGNLQTRKQKNKFWLCIVKRGRQPLASSVMSEQCFWWKVSHGRHARPNNGVWSNTCHSPTIYKSFMYCIIIYLYNLEIYDS